MASAVSNARHPNPAPIQLFASSKIVPSSSVDVDARWSKVRWFCSFHRHHEKCRRIVCLGVNEKCERVEKESDLSRNGNIQRK